MEPNHNSQAPQDDKPRRYFRRNNEERKNDSDSKDKPYRNYHRKDKTQEGQDKPKKEYRDRPREMRGQGVNFTHFFSLPLNTSEFKLICKSYMVRDFLL